MFSKETLIPVLLFLSVLMSCVGATYLNPQGPWVTAFYPFNSQHPISLAAPIVDAIADCSLKNRLVTVLISEENQKEQLKQQGAILIDPKGVPLCFWKS